MLKFHNFFTVKQSEYVPLAIPKTLNHIKMKKNYFALLAIILLASFVASAQLQLVTGHKKLKSFTKNLSHPASSNLPGLRRSSGSNQTAAVIWSDDFSDASTWNLSTEGGTGDNWVIGTGGPSGMNPIAPINSTTAANGFALFDSDLLCSHDQIGDLTNANAIDCSGHANVRLRFEEQYQRYYDSTFVFVSNDGTNWTKFPVNAAFTLNQHTTNPQVVRLNISSVAANQSTVYIRFQFYSPSSLAGAPGCAYAWMIDDVLIDDYPADDVAIIIDGFPSEYVEMPVSEATAWNLTSKISNEGYNAATNASVSIDIFQNSILNNVYSNTSSVAASIAPGAIASVTAPAFTPTDTGIYFIQYVAQATSGNSDPTNDTTFSVVVVTDTGYARDFSLLSDNLDNVIGAQGVRNLRVGQIYNFPAAAQIRSVTCYLAFPVLGDTVSASVYSVSAITGAPTTTVLGTTLMHVIVADDTLGNFITMNFATPLAIGTGNFCVSINQISINYLSLGLCNDIYTAAKAWYKIGSVAWGKTDTAGFVGTFVIRPNLVAGPLGIVEGPMIKKNIEVFPNPSNGIINIMNYGERGLFTVSVFNPVGQLVYSEKYNEFSQASVDLRNQPSGIYSVRIESEKESVTKSIIISNK